MKKCLPILAAMLCWAGTAHATPITYAAFLSGAAESPPNASTGTGFAEVVVDDAIDQLFVSVTFADLLSTTTASHIHCCTAAPGTGTAMVATQVPTFVGFPLGVTAGSYSHTFDLLQLSTYNPAFVSGHGGTALSAEAALLAGLAEGEAYLNIHTSAFPGGEIRGFLQPVPEPASLILVASGLVGAAARRYRRQR